MKQSSTSSRRGFLRGASVAGAAGVAVAVAPRAAVAAGAAQAAAASPADAGDSAAKGYRLTEHVRRYYRTTTI